MNISNYYWYFSGVLTPRFCDDVIEYANAQKEVMKKTVARLKAMRDAKKTKNASSNL